MMITRGAGLIYGLFAVPLAFIGLAIYGFVPKFYADQYDMPLSALVIVLLITRVVDVVQMPFIGWFSDQQNLRPRSRHQRIFTVVPLLILSVYALFHPVGYPVVWMVVSLLLVHAFYSVVVVHYYSLGAELTSDYDGHTRITTLREACVLLGLLLAALMPFVFTKVTIRNDAISIGFGVFVVLILALFYFSAPSAEVKAAKQFSLVEGFERLASNNRVLILLLVVLLNSIAIALPMTSMVFFVEEVLHASEHMPYFIALFFISAMLAMPAWAVFAKRKGKHISWLWAMGLGVFVLLAMSQLHEGDIWWFYVLCACAGICIGADFALPTAILADIIPVHERVGYYMGCLFFILKLSLALAAGVCLWMVDAAIQVAFVYAVIPAVAKALAAVVLMASSLGRR